MPSHAAYLMNSVVFLPVLVAVFWGVPLLAREFEQRTLPLAWSQDVSRLKWLAGKTAVMLVLVGAMGTALAAASIHLAHQYHAYTGESLFEGTQFQAGGWMPLTFGLAWLAVGIAAGAATRRVLVAIAIGRRSVDRPHGGDGLAAAAVHDTRDADQDVQRGQGQRGRPAAFT